MEEELLQPPPKKVVSQNGESDLLPPPPKKKLNEPTSGSVEVSKTVSTPQSVPSTVSGTRDKVPTTYQWSGGDVKMQQKVVTPSASDSQSAVNVVTKEMTAEGRLAEEKEGYELSNKKSLAEQEASKSFSIATENYTYDQVKNLVQLQSLLNKTIEDNKDPKLAKQTQDVEVIKKQIENLRNQQVTPKYTLNAEGQTVSYIKPKYKNVGEMYDETIMFQNKHQKLIGEIENYETKLNPIIEKARKNAQYTPNKKDEYGNTYYDLNPMEAFLNGAENSLETTSIGLANMFGFDDEAKSAAQMKWYKDNVISPKKADGLVSQGFEMLGGVAPLIAGGAVAGGSVIGSVVMNSLLFGAQDYGGTWYNSYASKKAEGMSDEEASKEANSNARFAGVKGMILGGTMPLQSMAGNKVGVSLFVTKAEQNSFRQFMYGQIGMLPAFGTSTALQNWYEGKPVTDNVGRAMIDAFIIGGMTHAIAALPKLPAATVRLFEHTIAKNYNKVSTVIDAAVQDGTINPTVGENIVAKAKAYDKIKGAGLNEDVEVQVTELQVQIDKLEASKEGASPAVIAEIDRQINELSAKLKVEAGFPLTFDERKELNLLQTARDSNKEYDKEKLAELEQRQKNNQDGKTKLVTDQPMRVKYKDGRTGLVFVNAEGDVEFVPDGNSAGLVIDKQAGASFRSLANLGFEQVVGETVAEPNSQLLSGDISLGTSVLYKGGKYQIASSKNAPDGVKLDADGKVRVVYLKGEDGKVIAVGADSADGKRIIDDANRVIGKGEATPTETAPVVEAKKKTDETVEVELEPTVTEEKVEAVQTPTETVTEAEVVTPIAPDGGEVAVETKQEIVEDAEYTDFIDKGKVTPERLNEIANKVKNQEQLSPRETEIFADKTGEINNIIATQKSEAPVVEGATDGATEPKVEATNFKPNKVLTGANKIISGIADAYKKATKLFSKTPRLVTKVSDVDGKRIADAFNEMKHEPNNPEVKKGFEQLITEIKKQADALIKEGFKFELVTEGKAYNSDSKKMLNDVKNNKRIFIEASEGAFGTKRTFDQDNIGLQDSGYTDVNGRKLTNVELIRAVHDLFGHSEYGNGFGAIGEENAWRVHMSMFTPLAQKALTATTRGQNSWVNFGNHMRNADGSIKKKGDAGYLEPNKRPFAEQKIGFLPDWAMENAYGDRVTVNGKEIKPTNKYVVDGKEAYEIDDAQAFFDAISSAKESRGEDGVQVALKTKEEYQKVLDEGGVLLVSKDGKVGVMLEANGNVGSGFAHADLPKGENSLKPLLITAIKLGGRFTDAYDGYLPKYYSRFGFKPSFRMKFNPEFADKGWEKTILKNEPDVVFMYFDGNRETLEADYNKFPDYDNTKGEYVTDYDKAVEATKAKSIELEDQASLTPPPDAKAGATKKETPKTETKVEQATEQVQKFKDVLDQRTDKKTDKALKAFGEQEAKAKELIDNYDTNLKKLEEKGVEVKGTKEEILADMLDGKYDEALKSDTSIPSSKTEIERRPITMLDGEEGIELIVKNADGTETSMGKFYATDTKEMDKIERGLKLADQQKAKGSDSKSEVQKANEEVWKAVQDLLDAGDITNLGFAAKNVGEKSAEALDRLHKALVNAAKTYLKAGGNSVKQFAKNIGLSTKNAKQAWDEAMGLTTFNKDNLDYDLADIAKVAIRRGIKVREKLLEVIDEQKTKTKNVTKSLQAIRDFVKEYSDRGNLTRADYQKILDILPSIKNQKTLDKAADKILDIINNAKSDKIEVSERTLLKDRIKAEVKAANEGYREARLEQKDIAQAIKAFMDDTEIKGALTPSQVKALVKRAASITTDAQFDKFIDYADKIIKDANLAQDLEDLRSNQKGAGKKRHNEKTADVRKFLDAEIFDEDGNLLLDEATFSEYSDAVAALNQKIPDHSLMEATDASGKTLSERVADQSQSASNPYMNINTVKDLMKAWTALDNNIVDVDSYKSFTRNISKIKARLKDLVQAGTITQGDYDTAISQIYKHENGKRVYEAKYGDQIGQLKSAQIADAQAKARLVDDSGFNKMQKELWQEFKRNMSVNFEKFKKLEVSDLDKLNTVLDRMGNGFMPEYEFRQVMNKIETQGQGVKIAKQVAKISDKFKNNLDKLRDLFETNDPARYEGELGIAGDNSLWNGVLSRTQRALKKYTETTHDMYEKWYDSLPSFYKITGKKPVLIDKIDAKDGKVGKTVVSQREYDMVKVGAVRHMINHAAEMMAKGKDPIDVFGEQLSDIKERQNYATEGELSILTDVYNKLKSNPDLLDINGELDYNKVWKSVEANDGKVLDVNQAKIESSFDGLDLETGDMITSSNAIRGVNATKNPKHIRRYYVGTRVGEGQINESEQIGVRAGSSYARAEKDMPNGAMLLNAEKIIQRQIKEAAKDYHINQELDKLNDVFEEAKLAANREDINVLNEFQQDQRRIMQYHLSSGDIPPVFNKIQGGLYVKMLTTPYRLVAEAVSNTTQMMVRGRSFRGLLTALPSETVNPMYREMTDIMKATESTSLDHAEFRSMKNIETKDGQIQREGLLKRGVDVINGVTNAMAVGGIWMPNFNRKFAELTGENYNNSMLKNPKYVDAMREASSYADRETETVIGSTLKGGARREIVLTPFGGKLKADTALGSLAKFLSNYPYRDTKELVRGINQMVTGVNEGRIDGAARSMGVVTNMMLYTGMYAITKSLWKQTFGDGDEKKEAKETIDRLSTKEGFIDFTKQEALSNAVNLAGTKYSQAGKMMTRLSVIALYNSNLLDETQKKDLANFAEAQLYMYFNKKSFRKSDAQSEFYNVIPHLKEASDIFYREVKGEEGVTALLKEAREKGVEGLTKDKQAQLSLLKNFIHTTNILLYSQGTQLPFSKDFVKSLEVQIKELNK
jgi:hypothetical protein